MEDPTNYRRKYEDAIKRAEKEILACGSLDCDAARLIYRIFPERFISEDERIRKFLIKMAKNGHGGDKEWWDKCVTWLEKQGNPTDKVEPKFKVGDWIACEKLNTALIVNIDDDKYEVEFIDGNKGFPNIDYIDKVFHLWTIEDAKDGDVLASSKSIFIFKKIYMADKPEAYYAVMNDSFKSFIKCPNACWTNEQCHPATKEQRELLFKKMEENGYSWDAEKKEMKLLIDDFISIKKP